MKLLLLQLFAVSALGSLSDDAGRVKVNKCCEPYELYVNKSCTHSSKVNETIWSPKFTHENGKAVTVDY